MFQFRRYYTTFGNVRSHVALSAEILFLRKQLAFYQEHEIKPRRLADSARASLLVFFSPVQLERSSGRKR